MLSCSWFALPLPHQPVAAGLVAPAGGARRVAFAENSEANRPLSLDKDVPCVLMKDQVQDFPRHLDRPGKVGGYRPHCLFPHFPARNHAGSCLGSLAPLQGRQLHR